MRYEIPFTTEKLKTYCDLLWKEASKEIFSLLKQYVILGTVINTIGIVILLKSVAGAFILIFATVIDYNLIASFLRYRKERKKFYLLVEQSIKTHDSNFRSVYEFADEAFLYHDDLYEGKMKWKIFKGSEIINDMLYIKLTDYNSHGYMISMNDIGQEEFEKLTAFVKEKIPARQDMGC